MAIAVGSLAVACSSAPAALPTASPSALPNASPSPSAPSSPSPSSPTDDPTPSPSPSIAGAIDHPTGATDIVLRMEEGGGMLAWGWLISQAPSFTLYGDGTYVLRPAEDADRPDHWVDGMPRFLHGRMTADYVQALLGFALTTGRLTDAGELYPDLGCADCGSTIFTINAGGVEKVVTVDALVEGEPRGPDAVERKGFARLAEALAGMEARARSGELGEVVIYDPSHYRVSLLESFGEPVEDAAAWPWNDLTTDDFEPPAEGAPPVRVMTRDEVAQLLEVPSGGHSGIWVEEPDGTQWQLAVRPLLPDELPTD